MQKSQMAPRFGSMIEIGKPDFEIEVNRAPKGVFVIVLLYQDYIDESAILKKILGQLA